MPGRNSLGTVHTIMPTVIATPPGDPTANSYATVAEADAYHTTRPSTQVTAWTAALPADKEAAVIMATELLDASFVWTGSVKTTTQALAWPRSGMTSRNGNAVNDATIPAELVRATSEFARQLLTSNRTADNDIVRLGITDLKAGPISLSFENELPDRPLPSTMGDTSRLLPSVIPDAVRLMIPATWYTLPDITTPIMLETV